MFTETDNALSATSLKNQRKLFIIGLVANACVLYTAIDIVRKIRK